MEEQSKVKDEWTARGFQKTHEEAPRGWMDSLANL